MSEDATTSFEGSASVDVVALGTGENRVHRTVPAGSGPAVVAAHERARRTTTRRGQVVSGVAVAVFGGLGVLALGHPAGALFGVPALLPGVAFGVADRFEQGGAELVAEGIDPDSASRRYDLAASTTWADPAERAPGWW